MSEEFDLNRFESQLEGAAHAIRSTVYQRDELRRAGERFLEAVEAHFNIANAPVTFGREARIFRDVLARYPKENSTHGS